MINEKDVISLFSTLCLLDRTPLLRKDDGKTGRNGSFFLHQAKNTLYCTYSRSFLSHLIPVLLFPTHVLFLEKKFFIQRLYSGNYSFFSCCVLVFLRNWTWSDLQIRAALAKKPKTSCNLNFFLELVSRKIEDESTLGWQQKIALRIVKAIRWRHYKQNRVRQYCRHHLEGKP